MKITQLNLLSLAILLASCQLFDKQNDSKSEVKNIWVNSFKVDCTGISPTTCLLIQDNETINENDWQYLYSPVSGFTFEPGFIYQLKVRIEKKDPTKVAADAPAWSYHLLEILNKKTDERLRLNDIWALEQMNGKDISLAYETNRPYIEFHIANSRVMGKAGCNEMSGQLKVLNASTLEIKEIERTEIACPDLAIEDIYINSLTQARTYTIRNLKLYLMDKNGNEMLRFRKID